VDPPDARLHIIPTFRCVLPNSRRVVPGSPNFRSELIWQRASSRPTEGCFGATVGPITELRRAEGDQTRRQAKTTAHSPAQVAPRQARRSALDGCKLRSSCVRVCPAFASVTASSPPMMPPPNPCTNPKQNRNDGAYWHALGHRARMDRHGDAHLRSLSEAWRPPPSSDLRWRHCHAEVSRSTRVVLPLCTGRMDRWRGERREPVGFCFLTHVFRATHFPSASIRGG